MLPNTTTKLCLSVMSVAATGVFGLYYYYYQYTQRKLNSANSLRDEPDYVKSGTNLSYSSLDDASIKEVFKEACLSVNSWNISNSQDKLLLYGLYKQATMGNASDNNHKLKSFKMDMVSRAKYEAWSKFDQIPKRQAMILYVKAVSELSNKNGRRLNVDWSLNQNIIVASSSYFSSSNEDIVYSEDDEIDYDENTDTPTEEQENGTGMGLRPSSLLRKMEELDVGLDSEAEVLFDLVERNDFHKLSDLLQSGAGSNELINQTDSSGQTPLHIAVDLGHRICADLLLQHGANPNVVDNDGTSVLQTAIMSSFCPYSDSSFDDPPADNSNNTGKEFQQLLISLLDAGADPDIADSDGATARSTALGEGKAWISNLFRKD